jgi:hypothetical protein
MRSELCGWFYCLEQFPPTAIVEWCDEDSTGEGQTALCPAVWGRFGDWLRCGISDHPRVSGGDESSLVLTRRCRPLPGRHIADNGSGLYVSRLDPQGVGDVGLSTVCADECEGLRGRSIGEQLR